jgi:hypothetical protein
MKIMQANVTNHIATRCPQLVSLRDWSRAFLLLPASLGKVLEGTNNH